MEKNPPRCYFLYCRTSMKTDVGLKTVVKLSCSEQRQEFKASLLKIVAEHLVISN